MKVWNIPKLIYIKLSVCLLLVGLSRSEGRVKVGVSGFEFVPKEMFRFEGTKNILLLEAVSDRVYLSKDEGKSWASATSLEGVRIEGIQRHPFDNDRAVALTKSKQHYVTKDRGESWVSFTSPVVPVSSPEVFSFHAKRTGYVIFLGTECIKDKVSCQDNAYYTTDFFSTTAKLLYKDVSKCIWGYSNKVVSDMPDKLVFCLKSIDGATGIEKLKESRLVRSKDFFESSKEMIDFDFDGIPDKGVIGISLAEKYLIAVVDISSEHLKLFISKDGNIWAQAHIPNHESLSHNSFTVLDSTPHSLTLAVGLSSSDKFATLYLSNSNGTYFTESLPYLDMDASGYVALERVKGLTHLLIANTVSNPDAVNRGGLFSTKEIKTKITYNNGGKWNYISPPKKGCQDQIITCVETKLALEKCSLHFHSIQEFRNLGPIFSRASSPGFLIGVGSVGNSLNSYSESDTFFSRDGGVSWSCAQPSPHKYIIGDMGSLLVLIKDAGSTQKLIYSYNQGTTWIEFDLPVNVRPVYLTTEKASTSQNALLFGKKDDGTYATLYLDFSDFHNRKCDFDGKNPSQSKDVELWYPKTVASGASKEPCILGHQIGYYRKKPDAECYMSEKFKDPQTERIDCPCSEEDYECDYNFVRGKDNTCVLEGVEPLPPGACSASKTFMGSSGFRLIPENTCSQHLEGAKVLDKPLEKPCNSTTAPVHPSGHPSGTIRHTRKEFSDSKTHHYNFPSSESFLIWGQSGLWLTQDSGLTWTLKLNHPVLAVIGHKYDPKMAYIFVQDQPCQFTTDQGKTFKEFQLPSGLDHSKLNLAFSPKNLEHLILQQTNNQLSDIYLTKDNGVAWHSLIQHSNKCIFASTEEFSIPGNQVLCSRAKNVSPADFELVVLDIEGEIKLDHQLASNVDQFNIIGPRLFVASFKDNSSNLQVSENSLSLSSIQLPPGVQAFKNGYVVHDSDSSHSDAVFLTLLNVNTNDSKHQTFSNTLISIGTFYKSDINGTSYSQSLPDVAVLDSGLVALQEVTGIRGTAVANQILEADQVNLQHRVQTFITFDNGGSFNRIPAPAKMFNGTGYDCKNQDCHLNLQLFHEDKPTLLSLGMDNGAGRVLAVGNVGTHLLPIENRKTYSSRDGGLTWTEILGSHSIYAMSDSGNLMVFVKEFPTTSLLYSLDGIHTETYGFSDDPIWVTDIITSSTGETLKFLMIGYVLSRADPGSHHSEVIGIDFTPMFSRQCGLDEKSHHDFETWSPTRLVSSSDQQTKTYCFLGQTLQYWRKKSEIDCYVGHNPQSQNITFQTCTCSEMDFECDVGYWRSDYGYGDCILKGKDTKRPSSCPLGTNYTSSSGYRRNPSTVCSGGVDLTQPIQRPCHEVAGIDVKQTVFDSELAQYFYFKNSTHLLVRLEDGSVWISRNEGYSFHNLLGKDHEPVLKMFHHPYIDDTALFMTLGQTHYLTHSEGRAHTFFKTPLAPNTLQISPFEFHPTEAGWFIFVGEVNCGLAGSDCHSKAFLTTNSGLDWVELGSYVAQCSFAWTLHFQSGPKERIFCEMYSNQSGSQKRLIGVDLPLKYSDDSFASSHTVLNNAIRFSMFYEFMVVASNSQDKSAITLQISNDGETFSPAKYPPDIQVKHDSFTVAESDTHSIVLHITTNSKPGQEMGPLLLSNSNGTLFTLSLDHVNQNSDGLVDFEKMAGIDGIALVNQVLNVNEVKLGASKQLGSRITFDNGATWQILSYSNLDSQGKEPPCKGSSCALHLHSFTERSDPDNIFSSPAAVGMMIGVGNTGNQLGGYSLSDTYFTNNAGRVWSKIRKGPHRHEFGDSGGIILLAADGPFIDEIIYSQDMGLSFKSFHFGTNLDPIKVLETAVEPQSTSQKLIVLGHTKNTNRFAITYFDFTNLYERKCVFDSTDPDKSDYELWSPSSEINPGCLFGRNVQFYRRKRDRACSIDKKFQDPNKKVEVCPCVREDFECDFNFSLDANNECKLIPGQEIPQTSCENGQDAFTRSTGYRKLPISSCQGGNDLSARKEIWCPGRGLSGWSIAFMVIIPLSGLGVLLYAFIRKGARRPILWDRLFQSMLPYLCFIPAMVVSCIYGQGHNFLIKLRNSFNQMQGYAPVSQYDYDLDEDYLDGPVEVQLEDYDHDHLDDLENGDEQSRLM